MNSGINGEQGISFCSTAQANYCRSVKHLKGPKGLHGGETRFKPKISPLRAKRSIQISRSKHFSHQPKYHPAAFGPAPLVASMPALRFLRLFDINIVSIL